MRVVCVWKENADYSREMADWLESFQRRTSKEIESIDPESANGSNFAGIYDVVEYPTLLALADDGRVLEAWRGMPLPRIDEVSYFAAEKLAD